MYLIIVFTNNILNFNNFIVAIRLTLCQLESAKFEIPRECKNIDDYTGDCVVALGKILQFWTTYDGFYREAGKYNIILSFILLNVY